MRTLLRSLRDHRAVWTLWLLPTAAIAVTVPLVVCLPLVQRRLIDDVLLARRLDLLLPTVILYGAVWLLIAAVQVVGTAQRATLDERLTLRLRQRLYDHCEALSVPLWHKEHGGRTMALFAHDAPAVAGYLGGSLVLGVGHVLTLFAGAAAMLHLSWQLAGMVIAVPPLVAALVALVTRPLRRTSRQAQDTAAQLTEHVHEGLAGLREIAVFGTHGAHRRLLTGTLEALLRIRTRLAWLSALVGAGQSVFSLAAVVTLLGAGGYLVIAGRTTLGTVLAIQGVFGQMYPTALALVGLVVSAQRALASADRLYELLDQAPRVQDRPGARPLPTCDGAVRFERVSFSYAPGRPVLEDVALDVAPGEVTALVGPSGAGKTTLAGLLARFYDPDRGRVLLDGHDLRDLALDDLRRQIGIVFQDPFLFATSVRDNVALGRPGATDAEVTDALRAAQAWEFVERLPQGLDTPVGQRAVQLSEGQKQRLAIARALLRDPRVLILDEPTASLDARSEHLLERALATLMRGRTTFVIAHRLATVRRADRIVVLENGRVVERGTHDELLARPGLYRELYELQRWWK